jgi:hypothetical protein
MVEEEFEERDGGVMARGADGRPSGSRWWRIRL